MYFLIAINANLSIVLCTQVLDHTVVLIRKNKTKKKIKMVNQIKFA